MNDTDGVLKQCNECNENITVGVKKFDEKRRSSGAKVRQALFCGCEVVALNHTHQAYTTIDRLPEKWQNAQGEV